MQSKLGLDFKKVERAKTLAKDIANEVQAFVESNNSSRRAYIVQTYGYRRC